MDSPLRLLVVTDHWDLIGGSERYARGLVRGLRGRGVEVRVLCRVNRQPGGPDPEEVEPLTCSGLQSASLSPADRLQLRAALDWAQRTLVLSRLSGAALDELLTGPPLLRFVQDHTLFCPGLNKLRADRTPCEAPLGSPCLAHHWLGDGCAGLPREGWPSLRRPLQALRRAWGELAQLRRAHRLLVASHYMAKELICAGVSPEQVAVLPYFTGSGPATSRDSQGASTTPLAPAAWSVPGTLKVLTPARLVLPDKGIDYLLTALGEMDGSVHLVIAGDGPAQPWLEEKARAEDLESRVHFTGWLPAPELEALYAACDLVAFPSIWNEPFGLVGLEAMAHGKPVVAFDVGGVREWLVPGQTGLLAEVRDTVAFAAAVERLRCDPGLRVELGRAGAERVREHFTPQVHLDRLEGLLG